MYDINSFSPMSGRLIKEDGTVINQADILANQTDPSVDTAVLITETNELLTESNSLITDTKELVTLLEALSTAANVLLTSIKVASESINTLTTASNKIDQEAMGKYGAKRITGTSAVTPDSGMVFTSIQAETDTVVASVIGNVTLTGAKITAEGVRWGTFTSITLTSGEVIAYQGLA